MERFCYEHSVHYDNRDSYDVYRIFDRIRGHTKGNELAIVYDIDDVEKIVGLLNQSHVGDYAQR